MKKSAVLFFVGIIVLAMTGCAGTGEKTGESSAGMSDGGETEQGRLGETEPNKGESDTEEPGEKESAGETGRTERGIRYTWQEVTVTLPETWEGRYTLEEQEDGFCFYQKSSYGVDGGTGFIWGLFRTREAVEAGTGELLAAFTDDGLLYYTIQPLDIDCGSEDEEVLGEYVRMCSEAAMFSSVLEVSGAHCHAEEYVLPTSSIFPLHNEELAGLTDNELRLARNEIYARHGRRFENEYIQQYFDRCTWYKGTLSGDEFDENELTQVEKDNLSLLTVAEKAYHTAHPYPKKYSTGKMVYEDLDGDGNPEEILYQVNDEGGCLLTVNGKVYDVAEEAGYLPEPVRDCFYITDVSEEDGTLEIAVLDEGPSADPQTCFFLYRDGIVSSRGSMSGFPFSEYNQGINGFDYHGNIKGMARMDLIETVYLDANWQYDHDVPWIVNRDLSIFHDIRPTGGHELYEDLPVRYTPEETASGTIIPAQEQVFFLSSDMHQWILVKGKDGSKGYMRIEDGMVADLGKPAEEVFSDLYFFD